MKKAFLIVIVLLLVAGALFLPKLLNGSGDQSEVPASAVLSEADNKTASGETAPEPVYVSDPIYGDQLTEEELEQLREEDAAELEEGVSTFVVGEEFVIELGETQGVAGF